MDNKIKDIRLKFNCPADWDSMKTVDGGKYCNHCQKTVYDFTDAPQDVFMKILAENNGNICGRFRPEQMAAAPFNLPGWKKWVSAAMVLVGINIFNNKATAQHKKVDSVKLTNNTATLGMVVSKYAQFQGGNDAFTNFIRRNLRYTSGMKKGKVYASFTVTRDGSISDIKVLRGLGPLNDNEVIRVLKLSPKWSPSMENSKPVAVVYTLPVLFDGKETKSNRL